MHVTPLVAKASDLGCALDCDLNTGQKIGGGTATDDTAILNAFLAQGTAARPVVLLIDGAASVTGLFLPAAGFASIQGYGWNTGFYQRTGSNQDTIHNGGPSAALPPDPGPPAPARSTGNVVLRDFRINGNRGNGTSGNANQGNPRGIVTWYMGINLMSLANVAIENVWFLDIASYAVRLSNCGSVQVRGCRFDETNYDWNEDGIHLDGPCDNVFISDCLFDNLGDDCIALNCPEGYSGDISSVVVTNCTFTNCLDLVRIYASNNGTTGFNVYNVSISNCVGSFEGQALLLGGTNQNAPGGPDCLHNITVSNCTFWAPMIASVFNNIGVIKFSNVLWMSPGSAGAWLSLQPGTTISHASLSNCSIYRSLNGSAAAYLVNGSGNISKLVLNGFSIDSEAGQSFAAVAALSTITGTISTLVINGLDATNITTLSASMTSFTSISGPGVLASGFSLPDAAMANGTLYLSATTGKPTIKLGGTVETLTMTP
jgi:hypothetical protein